MRMTYDNAQYDECARLASLLRRCTHAGDLAAGVLLHNRISASRHHSQNRYLANLVVQMYGRCGSLDNAVAVFKAIDRPNVFSWTVMLTAYAQNGHLSEARKHFDSILEKDKDMVVWNIMLNLYARSGSMEQAQEVFDIMPERDVVSWTALFSGYARNGHIDKACSIFERMPKKNLVSWNTMITVFSQRRDLQMCKKLFDEMPERDTISWNALISAYARNRHLARAKELFDAMPLRRDIASWNVMLAAYGEQEMAKPAFQLLALMDIEGGVQADKMTFLAVLQAAGSDELLVAGVHDELVGRGMVSDLMLRAALINAYGKCGSVKKATDVFEKTVQKNTVTWTSVISAYTRAGRFKAAVRLFSVMDLEGVLADSITVVVALEAYGKLGDLAACKVAHSVVNDAVIEGGRTTVDNELVSMYAKCGDMDAARSVFGSMRKRDLVTWNAVIAGYAKNSQARQAFEIFRTLELESIYQPNEATFSALLLACSHGGLPEDAFQYFASMKCDFGVTPTSDHRVSMVDLLARLGLLQHAEDLLRNSADDERDGWIALISACRLHQDAERAANAAESHATGSDAAASVLVQSALKFKTDASLPARKPLTVAAS